MARAALRVWCHMFPHPSRPFLIAGGRGEEGGGRRCEGNFWTLQMVHRKWTLQMVHQTVSNWIIKRVAPFLLAHVFHAQLQAPVLPKQVYATV